MWKFRRLFKVCLAVLVVGALTYGLNPGARGLSGSLTDFATGSFPPAGTDSFNSSANVDVQAPCNTGPTFDVNLFGPTTIQRSNPSIVDGLDTIDTEMTSLDLTGYDPTLGNIKVTVNPKQGASTGMVTAESPSSDFPATSFFDIFFDIETSGVKHGLPHMDLFNKQTVQMTAEGIDSLPPIGTVYSGESVPLFSSAKKGGEVGCVVSAEHVPSIDDFKCYTATATGFTPPPSVTLENQFNMSGFQATPEAVTDHCNPVQEGPPKDHSIISNPDTHLLCWSITTSTQDTFTVSVTNQFGTAELTTGQPTTLCLPSWKSLTGPPDQSAVQPPGLDHFLCYPVTYVPATPPFPLIPPSIALKDQFGTFHAKVGAPTQLCLPTQKTVNSVVTPITDPINHLLCFAISTDGKPPTVFDQNQFGTGKVTVNTANSLCVHSEKTIVP